MRKKERKNRKEKAALAVPIETAAESDEKKEAVEETLKELEAEKKASEAAKKNGRAKRFFKALIWPFTAPFKALSKVKLPLTVKMLLIFSIFFSLILIGYTVYFVVAVSKEIANAGFRNNLIITTSIVVSVAIIAFTALTGVISSMVLNPIRKITKSIDEITAEDLSKRLDPVDTQDEFMELTNRINGMLDNIEETFSRQENFVADASHELKTPISVINGYANMLKRWGAKDKGVLDEGIEAIIRESENMRRIVEQLLLLARIGKINVNASKFDANDVLKDIIESYKLVNDKNRNIIYDSPDEIRLETDKSLLTELIRILVNNAIKYTKDGGTVAITSYFEEDEFKIEVADDGIGISENDLPHIFDRFYRCDKSRGRESGGTGLGLTIAKSIVETLGGNIAVESKQGKGTKFTVTLLT